MQEKVTRELSFGDHAKVIITVEEEGKHHSILDVIISLSTPGAMGVNRQLDVPLASSKGSEALLVLARLHETIGWAIEWLDGSGLVEEKA